MWSDRASQASAVTIFALTLAGVVAWHWADQRVPQDDCADLARTALEVYRTGEDRGLPAGLKAFYAHSGWRPVLLPNLTAGLTVLCGGDVVRAASLALIVAWIVLYGYTYRCFRLQSGAALSAVGASFLTTLPPYFLYSCVFFADLPMLACLTAAVYHAERFLAGRCTSLGQGVRAGCWLALAMTIRPIEPLPAAAVLLLCATVTGLRHKTLDRRDLLWCMAAVLAVGGLLAALVAVRHFSWWAPVAVAAAAGAYAAIAFRERDRMNGAFAAMVAVVLSGAGLWYAPRMRGLAIWVWQCSVGDMAQLYKGCGSLRPWEAVAMYVRELGGYQLACVALLAAVAALWPLRRRSTAGRFFLLVGAAQVALVLVLAMLMHTSDLRRGLAGFYHLFIGLTLFSVAAGSGKAAWLPAAPLAALALVQTCLIATAAGGHFLPDAGSEVYSKVGGTMCARPYEDQNRSLLAEVQKRVPPGRSVCCLSLAVHTFEARAFCPETLKLLALEGRYDVRFDYLWDFQELSEGYWTLKEQGYDVILLDTRGAAPGVPEHKLKEPYSRLTTDMIRRWQEGSLGEIGWKESDRFQQGDALLLILKP